MLRKVVNAPELSLLIFKQFTERYLTAHTSSKMDNKVLEVSLQIMNKWLNVFVYMFLH